MNNGILLKKKQNISLRTYIIVNQIHLFTRIMIVFFSYAELNELPIFEPLVVCDP